MQRACWCQRVAVMVEGENHKRANRVERVFECGLVEIKVSFMLHAVVAAPPNRVVRAGPVVPRRERETVAWNEHLTRRQFWKRRQEHGTVLIDVAVWGVGFKALTKQLGDNIHFGCRRKKQMSKLDRINGKVWFAELDISRGNLKVAFESNEVVPMKFAAGCLDHFNSKQVAIPSDAQTNEHASLRIFIEESCGTASRDS